MSEMTPEGRQAYEMGVATAKAAASWTVDGNTTQDHIRRVLTMLDDGDPQAYDYLPAEPNLSGEWAEAPTPASLYEEIVDDSVLAHQGALPNPITEALCDAYEQGVFDTFQPECERILRAALDTE